MRVPLGPCEGGSDLIGTLERRSKRLVGRPAVPVAAVQGFDIGVEAVAAQPQPLVDGDPFRRVASPAMLPGRLELRQEVAAIGLVGMELDTTIPETVLAQPAIDDVERGRLLGDEQHRLSDREAVRDHVGDGLALAGARWPDDDEIPSFRRSEAGGRLRGIRGEQADDGGRRVDTVEIALIMKARRPAVRLKALLRCVDEMADDLVLPQRSGALDEILPHQEFREGEGR